MFPLFFVHLRLFRAQCFCTKWIDAFLFEWQCFSKVLPSPCGYVHHGSMKVSETPLPEGSMVTRIQQQFLPLTFMHWDFPCLPESFQNIMNWGWWKTYILCNLVPRNIVLTDHSLVKFGTKLWTTTHPYLQRLSLWWMLLFPHNLVANDTHMKFQLPRAISIRFTQCCSTRDRSWSWDRSRDHFLKVSVSSRNRPHFYSVLSRSRTKRTRDFISRPVKTTTAGISLNCLCIVWFIC